MATIYGLIDPRTKELRYIGNTVSRLRQRFRLHIIDAVGKEAANPNAQWIRELNLRCLQPDCFEIETVPVAESQEAEQFWIGYFSALGARLLNVRRRVKREHRSE